jgi:hypothetical protein
VAKTAVPIDDLHEQAREWNRAMRRKTRASMLLNVAIGVTIALSIIVAGWHAAWWAAGGVIMDQVVRDARQERRLLRWLTEREREREIHQREGTAAS